MRKEPRRASSPAGFTIVEMLIVILLIGILLAIAIPAFLRTRSLARLVACKSNLRQIYVALSAYATANDNLLPTNEPGGEAWCPWPTGGETPGPLREDYSTNWLGSRSRPWGLGKLHRELGDNLQVLFCPNDGFRDAAAHRSAFLADRPLDTGETPDCSYLYRGRDAPDKVDTGAIRQFRNAADQVRALAMDYYHSGMSRYFHDNRISILFEDGSVLDAAVSRGMEQDRFVVPAGGFADAPVRAAVPRIWRRADTIFESDD